MNIIRCIGDVHGRNRQYKRILKDALIHSIPSIQVGDLGLGFVRYNTWNHGTYSPNPPHRLMVEANAEFIRGNHDNPNACKRNSQWIPDGTVRGNMMLIGGAISRDIFYPNGKPRRHEGYDWWPDEELGYVELMSMIDKYEKVKPEIMITHDCTSSVGRHLLSQMTGKEYNDDSKTAPAL